MNISHSSPLSSSLIFAELKTSLKLALPLIASEVIYGLNGFMATLMISHLGKYQLAANVLVWGIYLTIIVICAGILSAVGILVAQSKGAKDEKSISVCFKQGLILALLLTIPVMLLLWFAPIVLTWTGQDPIVIQFATPYLHALAWTILPTHLVIIFYHFLTGLSKTRLVVIMSLIQVPIEVFFYYVFLFGKLGFPKLGLPGIGYGLTLSYYVILFSFGYYLHASQSIKPLALFKDWWVINKKFLFELLRVGMPLGAMFCIEVALFAAIAMMMGKLGAETLAAYQITNQYWMIALVVLFGLTQSATVRIGNEVGKNNRQGLKLATWVNIAIGLAFTLIFSLIYIIFPEWAIQLDINPHDKMLAPVALQASKFLGIIAIALLSDSVRLVCSGALRGMKDTRFPVLISILCFWGIAFPTAYLLSFYFKFGGEGILWGVVIGLVFTAILLFRRFYYLSQKIKLAEMVTKAG